jgi:hypothetical protein
MAGGLLTSCAVVSPMGAAIASDESHRSVVAFEKNIFISLRS